MERLTHPRGMNLLPALAFGAALTTAAAATAPTVWNAAPPTSPDVRALATGNREIDAAILAACATEPNPSAFIRRALRGLRASPECFPDTMTREAWEHVLREYALRPPAMLGPVDFWVDPTLAWQGISDQGPMGRAQRASLTYSFPDDGVTWGLVAVSTTIGPNNLNEKLVGLFGPGNLDLGREYIRQSLAAWRKRCGLTYSEVADLNVPENEWVFAPLNGGGDIRVGGLGFGTSTFLAYNAFPSPNWAGVGGGDMCFNTSYFRETLPSFTNPVNDFRYFRNTTVHEHGHGTGNIHATPCNQTKIMEPSIGAASHDMLGVDDIRGAGRNYGDRLAGNQSAATAANLGNLTLPVPRSVIELDLSTNGINGFGNTDEDWFRFSLSTPQTVVISADPTGGSYRARQQVSSCDTSLSEPPIINADIAGNLNIELRNASGASVLQTAASAAPGVTETLNAGTLGAGEYTIRVFDVGPNATENQGLQLYDLTVRVGSSKAPPQAIAGIDKRIGANANCFFMADVNSRPTESGASIASYAWDLNGDGAFESAGAKPSRQYVSNGVYPVGLRVTDSNGSVGIDTINVTVFGAVTSLTGVTPSSGEQGANQVVTLHGANLKNVTSASMVTVSGNGIAVSGTPVPNADGTAVGGLVFVIAAFADPTPRNVTVTNADGSATLIPGFTITLPESCPGDANGDDVVDFLDLNIILGQYGQTGPGLPGDLNSDGVVDFIDLNIVLSNFGTTC